MTYNENKTQRNQSGFTIVELMVGLVLGLILTAAIIQTFMASKQTSMVTTSLNNIQENARFALHFLNANLRNGGYTGCLSKVHNNIKNKQYSYQQDKNDYLSRYGVIRGWEFKGTNSGQTFTLSDSSAVSTVYGHMLLKTTSGESLPNALTSRIIRGSDVISVKELQLLDTQIASHADVSSPIITQSAHNLPISSILVVGDCQNAELFSTNTNVANALSPLNASGAMPSGGGSPNRKSTFNRIYSNKDKIYGYTRSYYYIGKGTSGLPSLFKLVTHQPNVHIDPLSSQLYYQELVEGVESLQALYGEDRTGDKKANRYVSANQVGNWNDVVSIRIGLLLRSPGIAISSDQANEFVLLDNIKLTHPNEDQLLRYAVNSTINLRNEIITQNLDYFVCDTTNDHPSRVDNTPTCR